MGAQGKKVDASGTRPSVAWYGGMVIAKYVASSDIDSIYPHRVYYVHGR